MIYRITHQIRYTYSAPVFLEPHIVRLRPKNDPCQAVKGFTMSVDPEPAGQHPYLDIEGNHATCIWFENMTDSLSIATSFKVETFCANPFGYMVTDDSFFQLPVQYDPKSIISLAPFLSNPDNSDAVKYLAQAIMDRADGRTLDFLSLLCSEIYENYTAVVRHKGLPTPPEVTIQNKCGACRDFALLYLAVCRRAGLASRFVSGYQEGDPDMENSHLHAWAEVYVPGGGWRGYDPTHGLAVSDRHVALAASFEPEGASPVMGSYRGMDARADMEYHISIRILP